MSSLFSRLFPIPSFFTLPIVGLDFSDSTIRFVKLKESHHGLLPSAYGEEVIPEGCVHGGKIIKEDEFISFLKDVQKKYKLTYIRLSIPESQVYSFTLSIDAAVDNIRDAIELVLEDNIPLKVTETVFDYQVLSNDDKDIVVQVVALSESIANGYLNAFTKSGLIPVSFELDGQAIARAAIAPGYKGTSMIVDFGANRTGITIVTNGTAVYTSTLDFGGKALVHSLIKELGLTEADAHHQVHEFGMNTQGEHKNLFPILVASVSVLKDEINKRYIYWHDKKDLYAELPDVDTIYLCGGYSSVAGLADYLAASLKVPVVMINPWLNCLSFEDYIPILKQKEAQSYVTAIGLALADHFYD